MSLLASSDVQQQIATLLKKRKKPNRRGKIWEKKKRNILKNIRRGRRIEEKDRSSLIGTRTSRTICHAPSHLLFSLLRFDVSKLSGCCRIEYSYIATIRLFYSLFFCFSCSFEESLNIFLLYSFPYPLCCSLICMLIHIDATFKNGIMRKKYN